VIQTISRPAGAAKLLAGKLKFLPWIRPMTGVNGWWAKGADTTIVCDFLEVVYDGSRITARSSLCK
jgi:hypothetical protein